MAETPTPQRIALPPERLERWLARFEDEHGGALDWEAVGGSAATLQARAPDGSTLVVEIPFAPLGNPGTKGGQAYDRMRAHVARDRRVAVILVRRGGYAVGLFDGRALVASKVGSRYVQGRTAAGGWSQGRFARRRDNQARALYGAVAEVAVRLGLTARPLPDAVVLGGDAKGADEVLRDERLADLRALVEPRRLTNVPDPKLDVLRRTPDQFRAVAITIRAPDQCGN